MQQCELFLGFLMVHEMMEDPFEIREQKLQELDYPYLDLSEVANEIQICFGIRSQMKRGPGENVRLESITRNCFDSICCKVFIKSICRVLVQVSAAKVIGLLESNTYPGLNCAM